MNKVNIWLMDTSIWSYNFWDNIIMYFITIQINELFINKQWLYFPTHDIIWNYSEKIIQNNLYNFVCWSNLLSSYFYPISKYNQWKLSLKNILHFKNSFILLWVWWGNYQNKASFYSKWSYNRILNKNYIHSVRDSYTLKKLNELGIYNVLNTWCPTMWTLTKEHCHKVNTKKNNSVLFTLTWHKVNKKKDIEMINILKKNYKKLYFFSQQPDDIIYLKKIYKNKDIDIIWANFYALNDFIKNSNFDYIWSRLHMWIYMLNNKIRSHIISIDNRATEISKDTWLPVLERDNISELNNIINQKYVLNINLPQNNIDKWKKQFEK